MVKEVRLYVAIPPLIDVFGWRVEELLETTAYVQEGEWTVMVRFSALLPTDFFPEPVLFYLGFHVKNLCHYWLVEDVLVQG